MSRWIVGLLLVTISLPGWGQSQDRFALTAQQVAQTLSDKGMQVAGRQVRLLANVVATEPNPTLDIRVIEPLADPSSGVHTGIQSWVRVACHEPGTCLPFYVVVSRPEEPAGSTSNASNAAAAAKRGLLKTSPVITMRTGTHALLVMDDDRSHIQVAVICLENGITGHQIRVASLDHKQVYMAEVVNAHLLRRSF
jgi:hypothetical protein